MRISVLVTSRCAALALIACLAVYIVWRLKSETGETCNVCELRVLLIKATITYQPASHEAVCHLLRFVLPGRMSDQTLEYFLSQNLIKKRDAAEVTWSHAVNSRSSLTEALSGTCSKLTT